MTDVKTYKSKSLELNISKDQDTFNVDWIGKSFDRYPAVFLNPVLENIISSENSAKHIIMNFEKLDFMNSETIGILVKYIIISIDKNLKLSIIYNKSRKWQDLNFSAIKIFETEDNRITISGI